MKLAEKILLALPEANPLSGDLNTTLNTIEKDYGPGGSKRRSKAEIEKRQKEQDKKTKAYKAELEKNKKSRTHKKGITPGWGKGWSK